MAGKHTGAADFGPLGGNYFPGSKIDRAFAEGAAHREPQSFNTTQGFQGGVWQPNNYDTDAALAHYAGAMATGESDAAETPVAAKNTSGVRLFRFFPGAHLVRASALSGAGNFDAFTCSFWWRTGSVRKYAVVLACEGLSSLEGIRIGKGTITNQTSDYINVVGRGDNFEARLDGQPGAYQVKPSDGVHHVFIQADRTSDFVTLWINGTQVATDTWNDATGPVVNGTYWAVGTSNAEKRPDDLAGETSCYQCDIGALWFDDTVTGLSVSDFYSAGTGKDLGADGSMPHGSSPLLYFDARTGDASSAFVSNRGTGGAFSQIGDIWEAGP